MSKNDVQFIGPTHSEKWTWISNLQTNEQYEYNPVKLGLNTELISGKLEMGLIT